jgi:hypothetical protein
MYEGARPVHRARTAVLRARPHANDYSGGRESGEEKRRAWQGCDAAGEGGQRSRARGRGGRHVARVGATCCGAGPGGPDDVAAAGAGRVRGVRREVRGACMLPPLHGPARLPRTHARPCTCRPPSSGFAGHARARATETTESESVTSPQLGSHQARSYLRVAATVPSPSYSHRSPSNLSFS